MSTSIARQRASKRPYRLRKRAEKREETRLRIVEAAVGLHGTLGPARTSVAQIAARAGVQRHTFYAHFPDERSLLGACSGHVMSRDPLPEVDPWSSIAPGPGRIRQGLEELYAWYRRNEGVTSCAIGDARFHEPTRAIVEQRMGPTFACALEVLGEGLNERSRVLLAVALDFACWQVLAKDHDPAAAARLMADAIAGLGA